MLNSNLNSYCSTLVNNINAVSKRIVCGSYAQNYNSKSISFNVSEPSSFFGIIFITGYASSAVEVEFSIIPFLKNTDDFRIGKDISSYPHGNGVNEVKSATIEDNTVTINFKDVAGRFIRVVVFN